MAEMIMVTLRYDRAIPVKKKLDRLILFSLSLMYFVYVASYKMILHRSRKMSYMGFVRKVIRGRKFLLRIPTDKSIQLYCRAGHEMDNLVLDEYENKVRSIFNPERFDTVVDVGAHLGEYTIPCAKLASSVIAIEANPDVFEVLKENIRVNRLSNIVSVNKAVFDSQGYQYLNLIADRTGMGSILPDQVEGKTQTIKVIADTLDNILSELQIDKVDWIKIDVEGAEEHVLRGAMTTISSNLKNIKLIIECHSSETMKQVIEMLVKQFGFICEQLDAHHIYAHSK